MKFLLVEDNPDLAQAVVSRLSLDGHVIDHAARLDDASAFVATGEYDLILLDIMLPDGDGRDFLKQQRARGLDTPVIVLTARSQVSDRVGSLDLGADDYLTKPFDHAELEARCRAVLRRRSGNSKTRIELGGIVFDPVAGSLSVRGTPVTLRNRELRLLELLLNARGQIFSKQKLADRLFSYENDVSENAIEVYVGRLRKHLEHSDLTITTMRGLGYRLDQNE
ncbi:response regulator transcription factor [Phaeobacter gallaeciensis]|jgi:two-component system response regulator TctD|uniref:response regulator transcription factor n=1 Tax=Phaeobacter gallaeciensis TaxID=60890 RepID=UPI00237F4F1F|nr:response regulator transcription factor [Phaeobacter gallaeciensis]MDE4304973.1 response regulator transcription factor [Phaeobacter gallaeciensis]MDE4309321.1 response regulator transcription factor [Phaeobacter gallaeciensis]MDE4313778.1 response regulator transcription factor [Phaeobacter gallaeciensis]MDE4318244.1 response regulator transcription factor [Phaeobacter gallaeciensis]MDE4323264.1 response regulator transcription factor [Phaeobacter gallaeciensis]